MTIYQHYRKHEHAFVDQALSWKGRVETMYQYELTDFLDPREREIVKNIIGTTNEEILFRFEGGHHSSERKRAIIAPFYEQINTDMFELVLLEASYPEKFVTLRHQDVMGTFLSLGIDRKKLGDIRVGAGLFQFITTKDIELYIMQNYTRIKNTRVNLNRQPLSNLLKQTNNWVESTQTASSLRLDVFVKEVYRMSRTKALEHIKRNYVKVNFTDIEEPALELIEGDIISVRGHGRSKLVRITGQTRKDRWRITTAKLKT